RRSIGRDSVEIAADSDVVVTRDLHDVLDMISDDSDAGRRRGMRLLPFGELRLPNIRLAGVEIAEERFLRRMVGVPLPVRLPQMAEIEIYHHHAAICRQALEDVVGHIARMVGERA